jgi:hypothetical protein
MENSIMETFNKVGNTAEQLKPGHLTQPPCSALAICQGVTESYPWPPATFKILCLTVGQPKGQMIPCQMAVTMSYTIVGKSRR